MQRLSNIFFKFIFVSLIFVISIEFMIRLFDVDLHLLKSNLYYSEAENFVHRPSTNAKLLNEVMPNQNFTNITQGIHPNEKMGYVRSITTDAQGYRYSPWPIEKNKEIIRIAVVGGSNIFGVSVSDKDTFTYQLAEYLNNHSTYKFQVWNGGVTASVLSQKIERARQMVSELKPDLLIIKHFHNYGRRSFYSFAQSESNFIDKNLNIIRKNKYFENNPTLYEENIPFLFNDNDSIDKIHYYLVKKISMYRVIHILINNFFINSTFPNHTDKECSYLDVRCKRIVYKFRHQADLISEAELDQFIKDNPNLPVVMFDPRSERYCNSSHNQFHGLEIIALCAEDKRDVYRHIHPPTFVYRWYAQQVGDWLIKNKSWKKNN